MSSQLDKEGQYVTSQIGVHPLADDGDDEDDDETHDTGVWDELVHNETEVPHVEYIPHDVTSEQHTDVVEEEEDEEFVNIPAFASDDEGNVTPHEPLIVPNDKAMKAVLDSAVLLPEKQRVSLLLKRERNTTARRP